MKLADAIRVGCTLRPRQAFHVLTQGDNGACALGAAIAAGYKFAPEDRVSVFVCPECGVGRFYHVMTDLVVHLNDVHRWPRENIADYLDQIRYQEERSPQPVIAPVVEEELVGV
jgi:hypothetical protein